MYGGSKCSTIKDKIDCESNGDCVWGKTGKCSQKRKIALASPLASPLASLAPVARIPSPMLKSVKQSKQSKQSKTKKVISEGPMFSWLEKMGREAGLHNELIIARDTEIGPLRELIMIAEEHQGNSETVARCYLQYLSSDEKPGDYSSQKYYCIELAAKKMSPGEYVLVQAWGRISEDIGNKYKIVNVSTIEEGEKAFKKIFDEKLKKKYKLKGWTVNRPLQRSPSVSPSASLVLSPLSQSPLPLSPQPGATLKNVSPQDLKGRNLKGIKILGGNMVNADLRGADLSGAILENVMFHHAKLDGAILTGATIRGCGFEEASLKDARFSGAHITESDLTKLSSADKAQFNDCILTDVHFSGSKFREANFANAKFEGAETQLGSASFEKANLKNASFGVGIMLTDPDMDQGRAYDFISFKGANLQNVKFAFPTNLSYNNFEGADLSGLNLEEADLRHCKFKGASLEDANLHMADLRDAELNAAKLKNADIDGAIINTLEFHNGILRFK